MSKYEIIADIKMLELILKVPPNTVLHSILDGKSFITYVYLYSRVHKDGFVNFFNEYKVLGSKNISVEIVNLSDFPEHECLEITFRVLTSKDRDDIFLLHIEFISMAVIGVYTKCSNVMKIFKSISKMYYE